MNILFAGSSKSSSRILEFLCKENSLKIRGVLTQPDKRRKRGPELFESEVSKTANRFNLKIFKPANLNDKDFEKKITKLQIDLIIVIAYGRIIPSWMLSLPTIMSLNVHFSILPKYRGASPIQSSLINGDTETGVSFMQMTEGLDEGDLILTASMLINEEDNKISLETKLTDLAIKNILSVITQLENKSTSIIKQDSSAATYCKKINSEDSITDFNDDADNIINKFKAYFEWPGLSFIYKDVQIKIHEISNTKEKSVGPAGSIYKITKDGIYVNTIDFIIVITYLQFPNKKKISALDAYNSYLPFFE